MKRFKFNYKTFIFDFLALPLVFLFVTSCFDITGITQPASAKVGDGSLEWVENKQGVLFSKLKTGCWPKNSSILTKIRE